jgi:hypothetical protein
MAICNPTAIYNAEDNIEAQLLCNRLEHNGIEAHAVMDEAVTGFWAFGKLPEIHKPQVWIDRSNCDAAATILREYEEELINRRRASKARDRGGDTIDAFCEECGKTSTFAAVKKGTTQDCKHCGAYMDVGEVEEFTDDLVDTDE